MGSPGAPSSTSASARSAASDGSNLGWRKLWVIETISWDLLQHKEEDKREEEVQEVDAEERASR